ncbi:alcohol dehydrogenase catalytic domain-containing protein [Streptomyces sp. Ag109_O5-1]|uniref:alcohol dehydrogenase catalytic domain-containing protein n=1 Tax=Streptomyces sp. Ag109_O5-1 TaxID=1938851 RepID=UPI001C850D16|nr:alcohol dehydrogenase catalytic domain-containing protein [Streptomyces sp. Ag109_O5-1]
MRLEDFVLSSPKEGEVAVTVAAAAINPIDWKIRQGALKMMTGRSFPRAMGSDFAGTVTATGPGVTAVKPGDHVYGIAPLGSSGAFAQAVIVPASHLALKPAGLSFEQAAALATPAVMAQAGLIDRARLRAGQRVSHPRTVNLRENVVCRALDQWIARAFAPDRLTATLTALTHASAAASTAETHTPEQAQARQAIKDCERRLSRYQAALEAGADPAVVTQWINAAQQDKEAAQKKLDALPTLTRKKQSPLDAQQIREITDSLGGIAQRIHTADTDKEGPLYEALGITISYEHAKRTATVRSRPSSPYRQWSCPRGDLNPHAR